MILDAEPDFWGNVLLVVTPQGVKGRALVKDELKEARQADKELFISHFATCPDAKQFR